MAVGGANEEKLISTHLLHYSHEIEIYQFHILTNDMDYST